MKISKSKITENTIKFNSTRGKYGCFSNFSKGKSIMMKGKEWKTSEHYFQAMKFEGTKYEEQIRIQSTPKKAAKMGRDRSLPLRKDWSKVKEKIMYEIIKAKFSQNDEIKEILIGTGDKIIVEHTKRDSYWGDGGGKGLNKLGKILMKVREELQVVTIESDSSLKKRKRKVDEVVSYDLDDERKNKSRKLI